MPARRIRVDAELLTNDGLVASECTTANPLSETVGRDRHSVDDDIALVNEGLVEVSLLPCS
jgi:hypothetical protein